jgi:glucuronate isomerase
MPPTFELSVHPDRLLPSEPGLRRSARELYDVVKDLPIISPHGHVPPQWLSEDSPFRDPTSLVITPDHYVTGCCMPMASNLSALGWAKEP